MIVTATGLAGDRFNIRFVSLVTKGIAERGPHSASPHHEKKLLRQVEVEQEPAAATEVLADVLAEFGDVVVAGFPDVHPGWLGCAASALRAGRIGANLLALLVAERGMTAQDRLILLAQAARAGAPAAGRRLPGSAVVLDGPAGQPGFGQPVDE